MPLKNSSKKYKRRMLALSVGLFLFAIYLFIYRGGFHSVDELSIFSVSESIAKFGSLNTDQIAWTQWTTTQAEAQGFFGRGGHVYSKKGLGFSLVQAPIYLLALYLPGVGMLQMVSLINAFITAITALLIFMFLDRLNFPLFSSTIAALIFGLATIATVYAKYLFSEPLAGFLLLLAAYMLFTYRQEGGLRHVVIAGLSAGFAVLTRANNLFLLPVFAFYLLFVTVQAVTRKNFIQSLISPMVTFILTVAVAGAIMMVYNAARAGNPLQTGYDLTLFSTNILTGLYKLLFSPLRGLFVYSPILLLSLPGWWRLYKNKILRAEAWLFAALVGATVALFSAWSSGEGLSWGSRFLVPVTPFLVICLAPVIPTGRFKLSDLLFYLLLPLSLIIQLLGIAINPWVFLSRLQADFGGEFFLEKTDALYNFRYSQIVGQINSWSVENSDLAWWQSWGFDFTAWGMGLALVLFSGWLLWNVITSGSSSSPRLLYLNVTLTIIITYFLLARYYQTDQQFGSPNDTYTSVLNIVATNAEPSDLILTVAQYHYHVPMNRFKSKIPIIGLAQQSWPLPKTALPLLENSLSAQNIWFVTIGFPPASPDNATERWLALNSYKVSDEWFDNSVRLVRYTPQQPTNTRTIQAIMGEVELVEISLLETVQKGQALPVQFIWLVHNQPQQNYNIFLQLLNPDGSLAAQHDSPPVGGYSPAASWQVGEKIITRHAIPIPNNLPPGTYRLIAGLYRTDTNKRMPVDNGADFVELGNLVVVE